MKKLAIYLGMLVFVLSLAYKSSNAQIVNGAYKQNDIYEKKPMPLVSVREADVFWSKKIWRVIDLREKANISLYYPTKEIAGRVNLISLLLTGIENSQLTPYDARSDDDFKVPMTYTQVKELFGAKATTQEKINFDTGEKENVVVQGDIRREEIKQYMLKEEWYFDKQTSTLNVRILGICPIREYVSEGDASGQIRRQKVFWIYFPEARPLLATNLALNPVNDARQQSFDDLFIKRMFTSYIIKESNMYNDRDISSYLSGIDAMLESKRIENDIFNYEQDLWEY
ncbi:gliding motility protein GldN [Maribellus sp. CM-23]|uniref:type IX secretion system ring protein PorN/GldN n=1 Tax=Maribellus sp. CM-23 TaxID=2781026 RepID=UPI001F39337E|nr:gliding motility protein GldN [Maribellus sp. CM-23]MCE4563884.1 gliding motility protein GldN [Maribellus sp. CM-23]